MRLKTISGSCSRLLFELQPPFLMALKWTCHLPLVYLTNILPDTKTSFGITGSVSMSSILSHTIFDILLYSHILSWIITTDKIRLTPKSHSHIFTWLGLLFYYLRNKVLREWTSVSVFISTKLCLKWLLLVL